MPKNDRRIGILTGGGDCPGLNAVIRAAVKTADRLGYDMVGFINGFEGLVDPIAYKPLNRKLHFLEKHPDRPASQSSVSRMVLC